MAAGNPALAQMMARQVIGKMAGGAPAGPPPGPPQGGPPPTPAGMQLSQQLSELQNVDPDAITKALTSMKGMGVSLYTRSAFSLPGVTRNLAQVIKYLDNCIEESQKAAATAAAAGPIANNAGIPNPAAQQGISPVSGAQTA